MSGWGRQTRSQTRHSPHLLKRSWSCRGRRNDNPFSSLLAMYIVAEDPVSGVIVKLVGNVHLNEATGQLTTTFDNNPQLPFSDLKLYFFGGERATLGTPAYCGTYTTNVSLAPCGLGPARGCGVRLR